MSQVKERPILFSGAMVRALLDGSKTQTRRAIKPQPTQPRQAGHILHATDKSREGGFQWSDADCKNLSEPVHCPYGQPGERLWVRETLFWSECDNGWCYQADNDMVGCAYHEAPILLKEKPAIPSIHMPRCASRLLLEITAVRCERVQDISEADSVAEGIQPYHFYPSNYCERASVQPPKGDGEKLQLGWANYFPKGGKCRYLPATESYESLWASINGPESWAANPWVWVVEFKVIEPTA